MGKRKTIVQHKIEGTFRGDRHNEFALQPYHERLPEPPIKLTQLATDIYFIECDFLNKNRLLNLAWTWQIAIMSLNISIALQCGEEIKNLQGSNLIIEQNGQPQNHPTLRLMWKSYTEAHKIACQLGITPVSFSRFKNLESENQQQNELDFLNIE